MIRIRSKGEVKVPPHWHVTDEHITVIKGSFWIAPGEQFDASKLQEMKVGAHAMMPAGVRHFGLHKAGNVIELFGEAPFVVNFVNPEDDPRRAKSSAGATMQDDPVQVAPNNYKVVFENDRVRVLSFHASPGEKWGLHAHPDAVVVSLSDYKVRNVVPGTEPTVRDAKRGDVLWIPARSHTGANVGGTDMDCVLVELKGSKK